MKKGVAAKENVQPGMIVLGSNFQDGTKSVLQRINKGPYPIVLQFYNLATDMGEESPQQALLAAQDAAKKSRTTGAANEAPRLSSKGTGLIVTTIQKPTTKCKDPAKRGDLLEIQFEARVASPGGPIYDSTKERGKDTVSFTIGKNEVVPGVDIAVNGMCPGEIRTVDIPAALGYGRLGSTIFDIPGDVRLWWKIELISLTKQPKR